MLDKKTTDAYKSIRAPEELRERVLMSDFDGIKKQQSMRIIQKTVSLAAAFALCITGAFMFVTMNRGIKVYSVAGKLDSSYSDINNPDASVMMARMTAELKVPLKLKSPDEVIYTLSAGEVLTENGSVSDGSLPQGENNIEWYIPEADTNISYEMTLKDAENTYLITLSFFDDTGRWMVSYEKQ